jgi:hypothetical protein
MKKILKNINKHYFLIAISFCLLLLVVSPFIKIGKPNNIPDDAVCVGNYDTYEKVSSIPKGHVVRIKVYTNSGDKIAIDADFYVKSGDLNLDSIAEFSPSYGKFGTIILRSGQYVTQAKLYGGYLKIEK